MQSNSYVSFVSDKDFLECVEWVCDAYPKPEKVTDIDFLKDTRVDPFKMVFDMYNGNLDTNAWIKKEKMRQADKTVNNRIGDFHQKLLGCVSGWEDLGRGHPSEVDLKNADNTIFIELKNKFNTMNSSSLSKCRDKLEKIAEDYPKATGYWAYIVSRDGSSGEEIWVYNRLGKQYFNPRVKVIWGNEVYRLVTGDPNALEETWNAIPIAINDLHGSKLALNDIDNKILDEFSKYIFR